MFDKREILKTFLAAPFFAIGNKLVGGKMSVLDGNEVAEMLASGEPLSPSQTEGLRQFFANIPTVNSWIKPGMTYPHFHHFEADTAEFEFMPLGSLVIRQTVSATIANNTGTQVSFDQILVTDNELLSWDSTAPTKIRLVGRQNGKVLLLCVNFQWETNATGYRAAFMISRDVDDAQTHGDTLYQMPAAIGIETISPIVYIIDIVDDVTEHMTFEVKQNSGGDLDLLRTELALFRIF